LDWPLSLLEHPGAVEEWGDPDDKVLYKGLRVRMGVHVGTPKANKDARTRQVEYSGPAVNMTARVTSLTHGGQILLSHDVYERIRDTDLAKQKKRVLYLGRFAMPDSSNGSPALACVSCLLPLGLTLFVFSRRKVVRNAGDRARGEVLWWRLTRQGVAGSQPVAQFTRFGRELQLGGLLDPTLLRAAKCNR
jgi:hypothetical protein